MKTLPFFNVLHNLINSQQYINYYYNWDNIKILKKISKSNLSFLFGEDIFLTCLKNE